MTNAAAARGAAAGEVRWWVAGDWNGFFGLFTNVVLNVIVLTGLCLGVVNLPADTVFGRILPALGIALPIGHLYYAYLAPKLAQRGRGHPPGGPRVRPPPAGAGHRAADREPLLRLPRPQARAEGGSRACGRGR